MENRRKRGWWSNRRKNLTRRQHLYANQLYSLKKTSFSLLLKIGAKPITEARSFTVTYANSNRTSEISIVSIQSYFQAYKM